MSTNDISCELGVFDSVLIPSSAEEFTTPSSDDRYSDEEFADEAVMSENDQVVAVKEVTTSEDENLEAVKEATTSEDENLEAVKEATTSEDENLEAVKEATTSEDENLEAVEGATTSEDSEAGVESSERTGSRATTSDSVEDEDGDEEADFSRGIILLRPLERQSLSSGENAQAEERRASPTLMPASLHLASCYADVLAFIPLYTPREINLDKTLYPPVIADLMLALVPASPTLMPASLHLASCYADVLAFIPLYTPREINLDKTLYPPVDVEWIPCPFPDVYLIPLDIPRPDDEDWKLGVDVVNEPALKQSYVDSLRLKCKAVGKSSPNSLILKRVQDGEDITKVVDNWVERVRSARAVSPSTSFHYTTDMPENGQLLKEWPQEIKESLEGGLPLDPNQLKCNFSEYVDIVCGFLDIPSERKVEALHKMFELFLICRDND